MTMTDDDLVKRLLVGACAQNDVAWSLMREAADRIEALTAEVDEARKEQEGWQSAAVKLMHQGTALIAERDRAYANGYADAETEISKSALGQRNDFLHAQYANAADHIKVLTADNARLREALQVYANSCDATETSPCGYEGNMCCRTARAALKGESHD
jgi:hypothetical protein